MTLTLAVCSAARAEDVDTWSSAQAEQLLTRWCEALLKYQVRTPDDPRVKGSLLCPACALQHGRVCDMVYPMCYLWTRTGRACFLESARDAVAWSRYNLCDRDGARLRNDFQNEWWGISVFSQCAVGKTLLVFGDRLPGDVKADWGNWFGRQSDFLMSALDLDGVFNVNYSAALCEAMALAWKLTGKDRYRDKAGEWMRKLEPYMMRDGMLAGEMHPPTYVSPRGYRAVDIGYNAEESVPALYHAATLLGNRDFAAKVDRLARGVLEFVLPDGGIDNSMGSRLCKWTYYGSRTSDGALPMFAEMAKRGIPGAVRAIDRHLAVLERCTSSSGLLAGGLYYDAADEGACVHHSFTHAKSLVDLLLSGAPERAPSALLPRETAYGLREFPSFGTTLAAVGPWCSSFSLNETHHNRKGTMAGGGSLTLLWHRALGPVLAATMSEYSTVERENMQVQRRDSVTRSMTPRIERGKFSSVADPRATAEARMDGDVVRYAARGALTADHGASSGVSYELSYALTANTVEISARSAGDWRYVLPVIALPEEKVVVNGCQATIYRRGGTVRVSSSARIELVRTERGDRAFTPIAGLMTAYLTVIPNRPEDELKVSLSVTEGEE